MTESTAEVVFKFTVIGTVLYLISSYWQYIVCAFGLSYTICWVSFVYNSWPNLYSIRQE